MAWMWAASSASRRSRTATGSTSAPSAEKWATPIDAQRANASSPSGQEAVGRIATRGLARPVAVRDRLDADDAAHIQAIGEADLIYLSGGKPAHLSTALDGSGVGQALRQAHERGAVIAGCSAGAMALAQRHFVFRRRRLIWPVAWRDGLGLVPGASVIPHYDALPEPLCALIALQAPRGSVLLGIDEDTAIVGRDGSWQVHGRARVTVWRGRRRERFRSGDVFQV